MIDRLKSALALAETLNFHRAAQRLEMSQPHLTRIIKSLERDLGIMLFERGPHGVSVTPDGSRALKEAAVLVKAEAAFNGKIEALRSRSAETLRIAVGAFISQSWAASAVTAMKAANAGISISLRELDWWTLSDAVDGGEFDLAIGELSEANKNPISSRSPSPNVKAASSCGRDISLPGATRSRWRRSPASRWPDRACRAGSRSFCRPHAPWARCPRMGGSSFPSSNAQRRVR